MGDPKRQRKKFSKPGHPWEAERIKKEAGLKKEYGLANKREIWKMQSMLRKWQEQARNIISLPEQQRADATKNLILTLNRVDILGKEAQLDDVLSLDIRSLLERRLQTQIYKQGFANSIKQSRQFITHRKAVVNERKVTAPSYIVKSADKIKLASGFAPQLNKVIEMVKAAKAEGKVGGEPRGKE